MNASAIKNVVPLGFNWETRDPFLFCVHHLDRYPPGDDEMRPPRESLSGRAIGNDFTPKDGWRMYHGSRVPGFPVHPHRGFETVTVVLSGTVDHADSMGAAGRYGDGDVQWMTAGGGVQHAEMFPLLHRGKPNNLELFQLWLNLPARSKFARPHYKMLWREDIPVETWKDDAGRPVQVRVVAGALGDAAPPSPPPDSWAADEQNEVIIWVIDLAAGATWHLPPASKGLNRMLYIFEGDGLTINKEKIPSYNGVELHSRMETTVVAGAKARMLLLQGRPIGEPVVKYGPFVMNTQEEIEQAYEDYSRTRFGGWPWRDDDPVHPREKGRFEKHEDGPELSKNESG